MKQSEFNKLKKQIEAMRKQKNPEKALALLGDFLSANPSASGVVKKSGVKLNVGNPLIALLLPILLKFLMDWLSRQEVTA